MKRIILIAALALGLAALFATAQDAAAPGPKGKSGAAAQGAGDHPSSPPYVRCDKDGDGVLSREEWPFSEELFAKLDKNSNGVIDVDERPEHHGKRGKGKGKGGEGKGGRGKGGGKAGAAANANQ